MDASGIGLGASLLQTRGGTTCPEDIAPDNTILRPITVASKSLTSAEWRYSNIEREALGILHGLEKFHHYCFAREVSIITDHTTLVAIFKKDIAALSQWIQHILLRIHQYWLRIIYKLHQSFSLQIGCPSAQSHGKQRWRNTWHGHKGVCNTDVNECPQMHVNPTNTTGNCTRWAFTVAKRVHHCRMVRN